MQTKGYGTKVKLAIAFLQKHCNYDAIATPFPIADMQMKCNSSANEVQTTKRNKRSKSNKPPQSPDGEEIDVLPTSFQHQSTAFRKVWVEWIQSRKEQKKKLTPITVNKQLKLLAEHSESGAIAMIEQSIRNGWQGLFEVKPNSRNGPPLTGTSAAAPRPISQTNIR